MLLLRISVTEHVGEVVKLVRKVKNVSFCWEAVRLPDAASVVFHCEALNGTTRDKMSNCGLKRLFSSPTPQRSVGEGHYRADILYSDVGIRGHSDRKHRGLRWWW